MRRRAHVGARARGTPMVIEGVIPALRTHSTCFQVLNAFFNVSRADSWFFVSIVVVFPHPAQGSSNRPNPKRYPFRYASSTLVSTSPSASLRTMESGCPDFAQIAFRRCRCVRLTRNDTVGFFFSYRSRDGGIRRALI